MLASIGPMFISRMEGATINNPEDAQDVQEMLKDILGDTLQGMLEAEKGKIPGKLIPGLLKMGFAWYRMGLK